MIVVDGSLSEASWHLDTPIEHVLQGIPNDAAHFDILWDQQYLYIGVEVLDAVLRNDSQEKYEDDSVDFVFDGNYDRSGPFDYADDHCIKAYLDPTLYCLTNHTNQVQHAWMVIPGGYTIEVAFPWSHFGVIPRTGGAIGFDIGVNDDDGEGYDFLRDHQVRWFGETDDWWDTSLYGTVTLLGKTVPL